MTLERMYETETRRFRFTMITEDGTAIADAAEVTMRRYEGATMAEERKLSLGEVTNHNDGTYSTRFGPLPVGYYVITATGTSVAGDVMSERAQVRSVALAPEVTV